MLSLRWFGAEVPESRFFTTQEGDEMNNQHSTRALGKPSRDPLG